MRRTLAFAVSILVLGTASAVGMAWFAAGVAYLKIGDWTLLDWSEQMDGGRQGEWHWNFGHSWNRRGWRILSIVPSERRSSKQTAPSPPPWSRAWMTPAPIELNSAWYEAEFGWPVPWLRAGTIDGRESHVADRADLVEVGVAIAPFWIGGRAPSPSTSNFVSEVAPTLAMLPLGIDWPSGASSIVTWSLMWFGAIAGARALSLHRARRRRRRGRCVACGHRITAGEAAERGAFCAECGRPVHGPTRFVTRAMVIAASSMAALVVAADIVWASALVLRYEGAPVLHRAAWRGDLKTIDRELAAGSPVDALHQGPFHAPATALMYAADAGRADAVKRLLAGGASPNPVVQGFEQAPLSCAAKSGSPELLQALADAGADPAIEYAGWEVPLAEFAATIAVRSGHRAALEWFIDRFPDASLGSADGRRRAPEVILAAAYSRDPLMLEIVLGAYERRLGSRELLCEHFKRVWENLVSRAAALGPLSSLKRLLALCDPPTELGMALSATAQFGRRDNLMELLRVRPLETKDCPQVIERAIAGGMSDLIPMLIQAASQAEAGELDLGGPVCWAIGQNDAAALRHLIAAGGRIRDDMDRSVLLAAIEWTELDEEVFDLSLQAGVEVNSADHHGRTLLMDAAGAGNAVWVERLLKRGADPLAVDEEGVSVLDHANRSGGDPEVVRSIEAAVGRAKISPGSDER